MTPEVGKPLFSCWSQIHFVVSIQLLSVPSYDYCILILISDLVHRSCGRWFRLFLSVSHFCSSCHYSCFSNYSFSLHINWGPCLHIPCHGYTLETSPKDNGQIEWYVIIILLAIHLIWFIFDIEFVTKVVNNTLNTKSTR